jgi:hypothetical protein
VEDRDPNVCRHAGKQNLPLRRIGRDDCRAQSGTPLLFRKIRHFRPIVFLPSVEYLFTIVFSCIVPE